MFCFLSGCHGPSTDSVLRSQVLVTQCSVVVLAVRRPETADFLPLHENQCF